MRASALAARIEDGVDGMADSCDYKLFGLNLRSEWALPELPLFRSEQAPDVFIFRGAIPSTLPHSPGLHLADGGMLLNIEDVARYWVDGGRTISVEAVADARDENVRLFLLGSAMGILLHQRGMLPLHANAVALDGYAIAFIGPSGAGKSTLASWFHDHGHRVIADDVCVVRFDDRGRPLATAGIPRLRLWKDALIASGRDPDAHRLSYAGDDSYEKYDVPLQRDGEVPDLPLVAIYLLGRGNRFEIVPLAGVEAADTLFANTYRGAFVQATGSPRGHWDACLRLLSATPVFRLARSWDLTRISDETAYVIAHARLMIAAHQRDCDET